METMGHNLPLIRRHASKYHKALTGKPTPLLFDGESKL
jgi:hypothetical protein